MNDLLVPAIATILDQRDETPDTRTYRLRFRDDEAAEGFDFRPGQFLELSVFGAGEAPFCLASSPTRRGSIEVTVAAAGVDRRAARARPVTSSACAVRAGTAD
jgi:NAD(P)H-flavin reductase